MFEITKVVSAQIPQMRREASACRGEEPMLRVELGEVYVSRAVPILLCLPQVDAKLAVVLERLNLLVVHGHLSIMHALKHAKLSSHHPLLMLLLQHVSLLVGIRSPELVHHGELVVVELLRMVRPWLLTLGATKAWSAWVGLLRLSLLLKKLGMEETICF